MAREGDHILLDNTHPWTIAQPWQTPGTMLKVQGTINLCSVSHCQLKESGLGAQSNSLESCCRCAIFQGEICSKCFAYEAISSFSYRFFFPLCHCSPAWFTCQLGRCVFLRTLRPWSQGETELAVRETGIKLHSYQISRYYRTLFYLYWNYGLDWSGSG